VARFYLDEHVGETLVPLLTALGHDALSTRHAGNKGLTDPRQLRYASHHDRIMVTFNDVDYAMLHESLVLWSAEGSDSASRLHSGIALLPSSSRTPQAQLIPALDELPRITERTADRCFRWIPATGWDEVVVVPFTP
jgi:hypothetical protein